MFSFHSVMNQMERNKTAGKGPGRNEPIELTRAEDGTVNGKHAHWRKNLIVAFIDRNMMSVETRPTPYTAPVTGQLNLPDDARLIEILQNH